MSASLLEDSLHGHERNPDTRVVKALNPTLWQNRYDFCINVLQMTPEEAEDWANNAVRVDSEIEKDFRK
jgi:hypothetical protein